MGLPPPRRPSCELCASTAAEAIAESYLQCRRRPGVWCPLPKFGPIPRAVPRAARHFQLLLRRVGDHGPPSDLGVYQLAEAGYPIQRWYSRGSWEAVPDQTEHLYERQDAHWRGHFSLDGFKPLGEARGSGCLHPTASPCVASGTSCNVTSRSTSQRPFSSTDIDPMTRQEGERSPPACATARRGDPDRSSSSRRTTSLCEVTSRVGRGDLIGNGRDCLVPTHRPREGYRGPAAGRQMMTIYSVPNPATDGQT